MYDNIAFYSDEVLKEWLTRFLEAPPEVLVISGIPFTYIEVRNEILRRARIKELLED